MSDQGSSPRSSRLLHTIRGVLALTAAAVLAVAGAGIGGATSAEAIPAESYATTTELSLVSSGTTYGDVTIAAVSVTLDGPVNLSGMNVDILVDDSPAGQAVLLYVGEGAFAAVATLPGVIPAGTHDLTARFSTSTDSMTGNTALGSTSEPVSITLAQAATETSITSAPVSVRAFEPAQVTAQVTSAVTPVTGLVQLRADGRAIAVAFVEAGGLVTFPAVAVPHGTTALTAAYVGVEHSNFAPSESEASPISVTALATSTELIAAPSPVLADQAAEYTIVVRNTEPGSTATTEGVVELLLDGDPVQADALDSTSGPAGEARVTATLTGLTLGSHTVSARYTPAPGFSGSESSDAELVVNGIATVLTPAALEVQGTVGRAAVAQVTVSREEPSVSRAVRPAVDGWVQAFLGDEPIGDPVTLEDGAAQVALPGLARGSHEIELRFTPADPGFLRSSATISAVIDADPAPAPAPGPEPSSHTPAAAPAKPGARQLATTGAGGAGGIGGPLGIAALGALIAGGAALAAARRQKA